ncbi:restriction endonuclease subunit S [Clostridium saudiense]|uniref:restriction endonuclease subunit S n=1 Tax=Clostridium saudiense TaxID=1414720 RepID=UPI0018A9D501|nr:restriction endonuclease subunit S [Clostridium saudiense]
MKQYKLKDITELITCGVAKRPEYTKEGIMFLSSQNVKADKIILDKYNYISIYDYERLTKINKPEKGDILYTRVGSFGEAAVVDIDDKFALYVSLTLIKPKKELVNNRYLMHFLNSPKVKEFAKNNTRGIGVQNLNVDTVREFDIVIPSLNTQKKIVECLDKAQKLIDKRKEQIEALDELVKSQFIEMFGDPITNRKGWNTAKLGDICTISRGGSPRPIDKFLGGPIPWIKIGDATKGDDIYLYKTKEGIIEEGVKKSRLIKKGGLIFANCGVSLGFARILKIDGCIHDGWLAFEDFDKYLDKIFFLKSLNYCTEYFRKTAPDGTQPNLNTSIMREYIQILPPMELQQQFTKFIEQVDKLKFEMEKSLKELEDNFNSLMQKAFKGELFN